MICVDTMIVVWGLRGPPHSADDVKRGMVERAKAWFEAMERDGTELLIPAPVLAEALAPLANSPVELQAARKAFEATCVVGAMDSMAALHTVRLRGNVKAAKAAGGASTGQALKVDVMILGVALAYGCEAIMTNNVDEMTALAKGSSLKILQLPPLPPPPPAAPPPEATLFDLPA